MNRCPHCNAAPDEPCQLAGNGCPVGYNPPAYVTNNRLPIPIPGPCQHHPVTVAAVEDRGTLPAQPAELPREVHVAEPTFVQ
jgi:hypothetical protein